MTAREREGVRVGADRCPFCHETVGPDLPRLACNACAAWHHQACWTEGGRGCSACGSTETGLSKDRVAARVATAPMEEELRPLAAAGMAVTAVVGGGAIGAVTNAINGVVSPTYFQEIMRWSSVSVGRAVAQGVFEGLIYGVMFAAVFTVGMAAVSNLRTRFGFAFKHLMALALVVLAAWVAGGLIAMGLATLSPEFYRRAFRGVPDDFVAMLRYAWVGGSIWGGVIGGIVSGTIGTVVTAIRWRRRRPGSPPGKGVE